MICKGGGGCRAITLTVGTDTLTGTAGNDTFVGGVTLAPGTSTEVNTLNDGDTLDGGAGVDTLQATLTTTGTNTTTPTLKSIENVEARFLVTGETLSLANATGVEKVSVVNTGVAASTIAGVGAVQNFVVSGHSGANGNTVTFDGGTATKLNATFTNVGAVSATAAKEINVNFDDNVFTEATIAISNSNVNLQSTAAGDNDVKTMTVVATGTNELKLTSGASSLETLTVSGEGSLDVSETATTALKTVTSTAKGGVTINATAGVLETVTTGDGKDSITAVGANVKNITTGAGDDTVSIITSALGATAVINLGAGDDKLTLSAAPTAGASIDAGEGTDTLSLGVALAANDALSKDAKFAGQISGFEKLELTTAATKTVDLANLDNISYVVGGDLAGVTLANLASGGTLELTAAGTGTVTANVKDAATGTADVFNLIGKSTASRTLGTVAVAGVETVNLTLTDSNTTTAPAGTVEHTLALADVAVKTITVGGNAGLVLTTAGATAVTSFDASASTVASTTAGADAKGVTWTTAALADSFATAADGTTTVTIKGTGGVDVIDAKAVNDATIKLVIDGGLGGTAGKIGDKLTGGAGDDTITASGLGNHVLVGGGGKDTITGGSGNDTITGGAGADTLTGNGGNDIFKFALASDSAPSAYDTITDFVAKTATVNGDVLQFAKDAFGGDMTAVGAAITVVVADNGSLALAALSSAALGADKTNFALDKSTGTLYIDGTSAAAGTSDGTADMAIMLTGVTTIDANAIAFV